MANDVPKTRRSSRARHSRKSKLSSLVDISPSWPLDPLGALVPEGSQEGGVEGD